MPVKVIGIGQWWNLCTCGSGQLNSSKEYILTLQPHFKARCCSFLKQPLQTVQGVKQGVERGSLWTKACGGRETACGVTQHVQ